MSFTERRAFPRYKIALPVRLENSEGIFYESETKDVSLGGMQVECNGGIFYRMLPNGVNTSRADQVEFTIHLQLADIAQPLVLTALVQGVIRVAETNFLIRLLFTELSGEQAEQLKSLLQT